MSGKPDVINAALAKLGRYRVAALNKDNATPSAAAVASSLRAADAREVWAAGGHTPEEAVRESLRRSLEFGGQAWALLLDGEGTGCALPRSASELSTCAASESECRTGRAAERHGEGCALPRSASELSTCAARESECPAGRGAERHGEETVMLFGVAPVSTLSDTGAPWMLATTEWDEALAGGLDLAFARRCRSHLADMGRGFARLENHVHADNRKAIRWLAWLGFGFDPPAPWGVRGEMFLKFWKECVLVPTGCGGPRSGSELSTCAASDSPSRTGRAGGRHGEGVRGEMFRRFWMESDSLNRRRRERSER